MNTDANVRRARLLIHWYTAFAIHYVFIEVQACGEQAKLQQTRRSRMRTGLTLAVASLMDRFNACSCSCSLGRKKHKSRNHDIAARRWKQFLFVWRFQERSINANEKSNCLYIQPLGCALRKKKVLTSFCDFPKKNSFFSEAVLTRNCLLTWKFNKKYIGVKGVVQHFWQIHLLPLSP